MLRDRDRRWRARVRPVAEHGQLPNTGKGKSQRTTVEGNCSEKLALSSHTDSVALVVPTPDPRACVTEEVLAWLSPTVPTKS